MSLYVCSPEFLRDYLYRVNSLTAEQVQPFADFSAKQLGPIDRPQNPILSLGESEATIFIEGVLRNNPSIIAEFFGYYYTTYSMILDAIEQIKSNKDIKKVTLEIDSPGGYVAPGVDQVWSALKELRATKEVIAINKGIMASGAYWIASAASKIYSEHPLTQQGSIGVYQAFIDWSENDKKNGIKEIRVVSKNASLKNLPTDDPKLVEQIQEDLDYVEKLFLNRIAEGRGMPVQQVIDNFGQGALVLTDKAIEVGMLDGFLPSESNSSAVDNGVTAVEKTIQEIGDSHMSLKDLMATDTSVNAEVELIRQAAYDEGFKAATEKVNTRVKVASQFIANANYNEHVHKLACDVLAGEASVETLQGVVAFFDQENVKRELQQATEQSSKIETGISETPDVVGPTYEQDGVIRSQEDLDKRHNRS